MPVSVIPGDASPAIVGESGHWTTPGGKPVYHCSTIEVIVGEGWLQQAERDASMPIVPATPLDAEAWRIDAAEQTAC